MAPTISNIPHLRPPDPAALPLLLPEYLQLIVYLLLACHPTHLFLSCVGGPIPDCPRSRKDTLHRCHLTSLPKFVLLRHRVGLTFSSVFQPGHRAIDQGRGAGTGWSVIQPSHTLDKLITLPSHPLDLLPAGTIVQASYPLLPIYSCFGLVPANNGEEVQWIAAERCERQQKAAKGRAKRTGGYS